METLVVVNRNHHHYNGRSRKYGSNKFTSGGFRAVNCRSFEFGAGLLPTPSKSKVTHVTSFVVSPKTPPNKENRKGLNRSASSLPVKSVVASPKTPSIKEKENRKGLKRSSSSLSPTPVKIDFDEKDRGLSFFERWAGPAYSNSPPPSSLPMPKFSMRPKRSVSLDLPSSDVKFDFRPFAKSAPTSPRRERSPSPSGVFDGSDCATKCLRRILNLDIGDE